METTFYMHIDSLNLAHYFSCACLKPARYINNKNSDIQNRFEDYLLFSTKKWTTKYDCSLEIALAPQEIQELINLKNDAFLYAKPLPITRVKKIYFKSFDVMDKTITAIEIGSAFIPRQLVAVISESVEEKMDYTKVKPYTKEIKTDFSSEIRKFDSLMGGFALMNTVATPPMNYCGNYFSTLARFNQQISEFLERLDRKPDRRFWDAFDGKDSFSKLYPYLSKKITKEDLEEVAQQEQQVIRENAISGLIDVNSLQQASYIIAILYNYGLGDEGRRNKINTLIATHFRQDVKPERSEVVALCYGLNRGYAAFANKYQSVTVKFRLDSQVDYNTIESLYQYAFNKVQQSRNFPYLDSWIPKYPQPNNLSGRGYRIFDKIIVDTPLVEAKIDMGGKGRKDEWWENVKKAMHAQNEEIYNKLRSEIEQHIKQEWQIKVLQKEQKIRELEINLLQLQEKSEELQQRIAFQLESNKETYVLKDDSSKYESSNNLAKTFDYETAFNDAYKLIGNIENSTTGKKLKTMIENFKKRYNLSSSDKDLFTK